MTPEASNLLSRVRTQLPNPLPLRLGVAVSGGSDSTALLHLLSRITRGSNVTLLAATVDHGLRSEAADEATKVAALCAKLDVEHTTLRWRGWDRAGNLQDQARRARYGLLREWANSKGVPIIALGHTADDQAETVLMRLARSAGVRGLSAMPTTRKLGGIVLWRPVLFAMRSDLRAYLEDEGLDWSDDPSNQDTRFDRIKARRALSQLGELGITPNSLSRVAGNLARADRALNVFAQESARRVAITQAGSVRIDREGFVSLPEEIRRRLVLGIVAWISGREYPPRQTAVEQVVQAITDGRPAAVGGCLVSAVGNCAWFCRELNAVEGQVVQPGELWDRRWFVTGPNVPGAQIRALGETGLRQVKNWREAGLPRTALLATPAVWIGDNVISAPFAGFDGEWRVSIDPRIPEFFASFLSH
ncbi:MAG: tRNA lysidine(34) synthetase TilS [Ruegeria sp.]